MRATKVNAGLAESNGKLLLGVWRDSLRVTCGLTACTPGSAPGPTLGNEYGKTLPLPLHPQDGDSIVAIDYVTSLHPVYIYDIMHCFLRCFPFAFHDIQNRWAMHNGKIIIHRVK